MKAIERVMEALLRKGLKPYKVEKDLHFSNGYLSTMQKRNADIGETNLIKIAHYLNFSLQYLITGEEIIAEEKSSPTDNLELLELHQENRSLRKEIDKLKEEVVRLKSRPIHNKSDYKPDTKQHELGKLKQK